MTSCVAVSEGKNAEEGTMISVPETESNPVAVADPSEAQTLTPVTTE
jgi:hypothetical protein